MTKVCVKCGITAESSFFVKSSCKTCVKEYRAAYYKTNKDKAIAQMQKWSETNRERSREIKKKWSDANPEKQREAIAAWQVTNKERFDESKKKWSAENSDKLRTHCVNRRRKLSEGTLSLDIVNTLLVRQVGNCAGCGKHLNGDYHIDHVLPIAKGGSNTDDNVQLLHSRCNLIKAAKYPWEVKFPS